ncbi:MAG: hypothetical protein ICV81_14015 [Flavisolibacter sp.]|nr:hypothetical protein [Flavisolibacter sp.]
MKHILKDKTAITNKDLEKRLFKEYEKELTQLDMFNPITDPLKEAYRLRNKDIAFSPYKKEAAQKHD